MTSLVVVAMVLAAIAAWPPPRAAAEPREALDLLLPVNASLVRRVEACGSVWRRVEADVGVLW